MSFPAPTALRYEKNVFSSLFNMMSRTLVDPANGQPIFYCTSNFKGELSIYLDPSKQQLLLKGARPDSALFKGNMSMMSRALNNWIITDPLQNNKPLGTVRSNMMKEALSFGRECWEIVDMSDQPVLTFAADGSDSVGKRLLDGMFKAFYNPSYTYHLTNLKGEPVAHYTTQHRLFKYSYSVTFEPKITPLERQLATVLFVGMTLMLKK